MACSELDEEADGNQLCVAIAFIPLQASTMSHHGESLSHLWDLSPEMNMPLCRVVAEETFRYRERLPIAAPNVWPHLTISDVNHIHAEIEKYLIFLNARNGLFNLEGLSQQ